jgi:hypothetical protein
MSIIYTVPYTGTLTASGGDADLFELTPADDKPIRIRGLVLGQTSELGDAQEENLRISIIRLPATVTSGNGTAVTPVALHDNDSTAGFAAEANGATVATTSGTAVIVEEFAWNIRQSPLERWWPESEMCPQVRQASAMVVRCQSTAADDITICITAYVEEL